MQGARWYFDRKILLLHGKKIPLKLHTSRSSVSRIYARERIVVMPHTQQNVLVKLVRPSLRIQKSDWLVEPRTLAESVHIARVLLPNEDSCAAVRCCALLVPKIRAHLQLMSQPYTLVEGAEVGHANTARVLGSGAGPMKTGASPRDPGGSPREPSARLETIGLGRGAGTCMSGLTRSSGVMPLAGTSTRALNPGTLRPSADDCSGPVLTASPAADEYAYLQPIIDSLSSELTAHERDTIQSNLGYNRVFSKSE